MYAGQRFAFQAPARFGGKSHRHPDLEMEKNINKTDSYFQLNFISPVTWITEKELERQIKNKGDKFRWKKYMNIF